MKKANNKYALLGVSATKEDVHKATSKLDRGIFKNSFCNVFPDESSYHANIMHADGAGTKSSLAYLYYLSMGNKDIWKGIAQDALVMNIDDMLCVGMTGELVHYVSTIGRNKNLISGDIVSSIIGGTSEIIEILNEHGMNIVYAGGETADIGDLVRTVVVDGAAHVRIKRKNLLISNITEGDVVIGLASYGKATYEKCYNSGIGSNGLTLERHGLLQGNYRRETDTFDPHTKIENVYAGSHDLLEKVNIDPDNSFTLGELMLSPTRSYAPVIISILNEVHEGKNIHAIIHNSGGGQTKILKFLPENISVIKNNLFPTPKIFQMIQESSGASTKEMLQVFNMGSRMEIYCPKNVADDILDLSRFYSVDAQIIGECVKRTENKYPLEIKYNKKTFCYK